MQLHAIWFHSCLYLWADAPAGEAQRPVEAPADAAPPHPRALPADALRAVLGDCCADALVASAAAADTLVLRLPSNEHGPLPSNMARCAEAGENDPAGLAVLTAWTVPALRFSPSEAIDLLVALPDPLPELFGPSVGYWRQLARFVVQRLAHQQFYPDLLQPQQGVLRGQWRLLAAGSAEALALEQFAAAMPPVCQSIDGAAPDALAAAGLVEGFLHTTADVLIRRDVSIDPFFNRAHEKAAEALAPAEVRWLSALLGTESRLRGSADELAGFAEQTRTWVGRLDESRADDALRLAFELIEPEDDDDLALIDPAGVQTTADDNIASSNGNPAPAIPTQPTDSIASNPARLANAAQHAADNGDSLSDTAPADAVQGIDEPATGSSDEAAGSGDEAAGSGDEAAGSGDQAEDVDEVWRLRFLLEPGPDAEGETIDAVDLWKDESTGILGRSLSARRQRLTRELARAAQIYPALDQVLASPRPTELRLSTFETHVFIRQWAQLLQEHGFGVRLPDWTLRRDREIGLLMTLRPDVEEDDPFDSTGDGHPAGVHFGDVTSGRLGLEHLLDFDWQIAVGDLRLSIEEFRALAERQQPLVKYKGQWIHLEPDAAQRAMDFVQQRGHGRITLADAFRTAYGIARADTGLPILGLSGLDWIDHLLKQSPGHLEALEQPAGFQGELRPYQKRGLQWLAFLDRLGIGACLADDMGLGKTPQLISLLLLERERVAQGNGPANLPPTLLFAPTSVVGNWVRELERFAPQLRVMVHHGPQRLQGEDFAAEAKKHDIVITSYALAHRDVETLARPIWWRVALDEAQKIKNPSAASTQSIRAIPAVRRVALTGTPIENHLSELWSIMELLNPGLLGTPGEFRERFAVPIEKLADADRAQQLRRMIQPFVLRRSKSDPAIAGDLPEKMEQKIYCNLSTEQAAAYERITADMLGQIDAATGIRRRGLILAALTRLKQVCNHPILLTKEQSDAIDGRSGKCERLVEMLEEVIDAGDAALIFTQYREMGHLLEKLIRTRLKHEPLFLHGGTPARARDQMIERFQSGDRDAPRLFILSLRAGGLGLNLTAANHVFHFDRWWNPAVESQATDRAYRIGQTRKVQVHKFVCIGTVEERIDRLLSDKIALADKIVTAGDEWLTNLSTEELRNYLQLTGEAVGDF